MDADKRKRIEAAGWTAYDDARDWLGFSPEEKAMSDLRIAAARAIGAKAKSAGVSQSELARRMGTRQPAVSRMLRDPSGASFESMFRALIALGATRRDIAAALAD